MSPDDAFLQAILENPDDDGPRLMYADWLTEQGNPRGEFIRVQCELHTLSADDSRRAVLKERESQLLTVFGHLWRAPLLTGTPARFSRGFLEYASLDAEGDRLMFEELMQRHPITALRVSGDVWIRAFVNRLAKYPGFRRLRELDLTALGLAPWHLRTLLTSPRLGRLRRLRLYLGEGHDAQDLGAINSCPRLNELQELDLSGSRIRRRGCELLADAPYLTSLIQLGLSRTAIDNTGIAALAAAPLLGPVACLDLSGNAISSAGVASLIRSPHLARLERLDLSGNPIDEADRQALRERFGESVCIF
jgi:uncharacterized protein (TIGR02996 family)